MSYFTDEPPQQLPGGNGNVIGTIIQSGAALYDSYQNRKQSEENTNKTIQANKDSSEAAYQRDVEQWKMQNEYNSPTAQMARLKAAGLNPNLVYGNGTVGNSSGPGPKFNPPTADYSRVQPRQIAPSIGSALSMYQDFSLRQAQVNNIKANTDATRQKTINEAIKSSILGTKKDSDAYVYNTKQKLQPYQNTILENRAKESSAQVEKAFTGLIGQNWDNLNKQYQAKIAESNLTTADIKQEQQKADLLFAQYKNQWAAMGITSSDNIVLRMFVRMLAESGLQDQIMNWMKTKASTLMK